MKKLLLLLFSAFFTVASYAQITFEKGYFLDNDNTKVDCLIKFTDEKNTPQAFEYRLSEASEVRRASISEASEFAIEGVVKYVRKTVEIDRSSQEIQDLTGDRNPTFSKETLFLKVLLESEESLYSYTHAGVLCFFLGNPGNAPITLVYKKI